MKVTETALRRIQMRAEGMTVREIAKQEGVTISNISSMLIHAPYAVGRLATPGSPLPEGFEWDSDTRGQPWVRPSRDQRGGFRNRPDVMKWVLAVLNSQRDPETCETCGRPL